MRLKSGSVFHSSWLGAAMLAGVGSAAHAEKCSPLYQLPAVQAVIDEHVVRVFRTRKSNMAIPYDVARNVELLSERVTKALKATYVDNPTYSKPKQEKQEIAVDAALALGLDALIACFPSYKQVYTRLIEPQQRLSSQSRIPSLETSQAKAASDSEASEISPDVERSRIVATPEARAIWTEQKQREEAERKRAVEAPSQAPEPSSTSREGRQREDQEAVKKAEEQKAAQAAYEKEAADPANILRQAYHNYFLASTCYDVRKGLAFQFINEAELSETRVAIKKVETKLKSDRPDLDTEKLWADTVSNFGDARYFIYMNDVVADAASRQNPMLAAAIQTMRGEHGKIFSGNNGAERLSHFKMLLRDPREKFDTLRAKCLDADQNVKKTLAQLVPAALVPQKDF